MTSKQTLAEDGVHAMVPRERMCPSARLLRDTYAITPGARFCRQEFSYYCLEQWYEQGLSPEASLAEVFGYDPSGKYLLKDIGWCEAPFEPQYEVRIVEDRGEHEVVQDSAGRHVLYFKGRRDGFMPEYLDHPVKDWKTWEEHVKWRLDPTTTKRYEGLGSHLERVKEQAAQGMLISQRVIGGYMFLRSLIGPEQLFYMLCEASDLLHDCMRTWLGLADAIIARHQEHVTIDELYLAEDICYRNGCLISPDMLREFLFPYYQQLITNMKRRQIDRRRHLYVQVDSDGNVASIIPLYMKEASLDVMSPFEVASGCDVVKIGKAFPDLVILGGIDKRVLATSKEAIDAHIEYIFPAMRERGGYVPTCDHGVPPEVTLENYKHYRKRALELGG